MSLSRIEAERFSPPRDAVDLVQIGRGGPGRLRPSASRAGRMRSSSRTGRARPWFPATGPSCFSCLRNLIVNAVKYGRAESPIDVTIEDDGPSERQDRHRRPRRGHSGRASAAAHRAFLSGRCGPEPGRRRHRPRPRHRQAYRQPPSRPAGHREASWAKGRRCRSRCRARPSREILPSPEHCHETVTQESQDARRTDLMRSPGPFIGVRWRDE